MRLQEAIETLVQKYGSHKAVALILGYTPEHYRGLRNGRFPIPLRTQNAIIKKASELTANETISSSSTNLKEKSRDEPAE